MNDANIATLGIIFVFICSVIMGWASISTMVSFGNAKNGQCGTTYHIESYGFDGDFFCPKE